MAELRSVVVLGGGVVGITSAYFLAKNGCQVTLIERRGAAGLETSYANGGLITPSMSDPWAAPGTLLMLLKWMGRENSPFLIRPGALPGLMTWGVKFLRQCNAAAWRRNTKTIFRLSRYSHECLKQLAGETGLDYNSNTLGTMHLFRDRISIDSAHRVANILGGLGVKFDTLDPQGCVKLEPALASQEDQISGAIHYPDDEAGDAHVFSQSLSDICATMGVVFRYDETVRGLETFGEGLLTVITDKGRIPADVCVVALGNQSADLVRSLGIKLPIYPVKGYSITFPVEGWNGAPRVPFVDDGRKIGIVRIGEQVRVAGTAEFNGYNTTLNASRLENLRTYFSSLFPDFPNRGQSRDWTGLRPMTPDGIPYLGPTPVRGLYLNSGHGHLGWTMSCGSAKLISDLVLGRRPEIDLSGLTLADR